MASHPEEGVITNVKGWKDEGSEIGEFSLVSCKLINTSEFCETFEPNDPIESDDVDDYDDDDKE